MKQDNINSALMFVSQNIPPERVPIVKARLETVNDSAFALMLSQKMMNPIMIILMGIFFGCFGVDRFLTRDSGLGALRIVLWVLSIIIMSISITGILIFNVIGILIFNVIGILIVLGEGIWILVDVCTATKRCREKNYIDIIKILDLAGEDTSSHDSNYWDNSK